MNGQENRNMGVYYMRRRIQVEAEKPQFCVTTGITFAQADAWFGNTVQDLKLDLIYPRDNTRKYPCVVWICGGAWIQMDRSAHLAYLSVLAQQGFVVASVEYRTSNEAKFPAPLQDVKAGIRYLRAHADRFNIDPDRIGVMGESAGGYLTCMAALATDPVYDVGEIWNIPVPYRPPARGTRRPISADSSTVIRSSVRHLRSPFCWAKT